MAQRVQTTAALRRLSKLASRFIQGQTPLAGDLHAGGSKIGRQRLWPQTASPTTGLCYSNGFRALSTTTRSSNAGKSEQEEQDDQSDVAHQGDQEHAIISAFDLFSVGIGPSSSHTVGPMRAGNIFVVDLIDASVLHKVNRIRISIYGSLALTGEGHMTPSALLLGLEGADVATIDTDYVHARFAEIKKTKKLRLSAGESTDACEIDFDYGRDFTWEWSRKLPTHSNGMRFRVFDENGDMLATSDLFSVGGGFVINGGMSIAPSQRQTETELLQHDADAGYQSIQAAELTASESHSHPADLPENFFYKEIKRSDAVEERRTGSEGNPRSHKTSSGQAQLPQMPETGTNSLEMSLSDPAEAEPRHAPLLFRNGKELLALCKQRNLTIAQLMFENEKSLGLQEHEIFDKLFHLWDVMDNCIREGVQAPSHAALPGSLQLRRRAPALYQQLTRGLYPEHTQVQQTAASRQIQGPSYPTEMDGLAVVGKTEAGSQTPARRRGLAVQRRRPLPRILGSLDHPISISPIRSASLPAMDYLTVYAIAVNETNAAGGRVVTAPTNGAAGIIPAVLKYVVEFVSDDPERDIPIFLLTAAAIASLFKRGATISAAEGGCMAEVGVACSMAAGAYAACMGAAPETIEQAAEIGIEHNLGLTCDPVAGLVQAPCIERNALGAIKAVSSANLALNSVAGMQKVTLDDAIRAMRLTAKGMKDEFKETSLSGLATSVPLNIPVSVPDC